MRMHVNKCNVVIGDRYSKIDAPRIFWKVVSAQKTFDGIDHAVLIEESEERRQMLISFIGLGITSLYKKLTQPDHAMSIP
jgi:hypothetical protein